MLLKYWSCRVKKPTNWREDTRLTRVQLDPSHHINIADSLKAVRVTVGRGRGWLSHKTSTADI
jgi:hypothetical protein